MTATWIKLHNNFFRNPKVLAAGEDAALLYIQGLLYCSDSLTDGAIPTAALRTLTSKKDARTLARVLVREGLWIETATGWQVHDYLEVQRSRAQVEAQREAAKNRQRKSRAVTPSSQRESRRDSERTSREVTAPETDTETDADTAPLTPLLEPPDPTAYLMSEEEQEGFLEGLAQVRAATGRQQRREAV